MTTLTFNTAKELNHAVKYSNDFKTVKTINGINIDSLPLGSLETSNKYIIVKSYTPFVGHKSQFIQAPYSVEFN